MLVLKWFSMSDLKVASRYVAEWFEYVNSDGEEEGYFKYSAGDIASFLALKHVLEESLQYVPRLYE